jgi:hypothetical protein
MEQLRLLDGKRNHCTQEIIMMDEISSTTYAQEKQAQQEASLRLYRRLEEYFATLSEEQQRDPKRFSMAADQFNATSQATGDGAPPYFAQGLSSTWRSVTLRLTREASPSSLMTPRRKYAFQIADALHDANVSWITIAEVLNRRGFRWKATGKLEVPYTGKSASDLHRHSRERWPIKPRKNSRVHRDIQEILNSTFLTIRVANKTKQSVSYIDDEAPVSPPPVYHEVVVPPVALSLEPPVAPVTCLTKAKAIASGQLSTGDLVVLKKRYGNTSIEFTVEETNGTVDATVRYSGESSSSVTELVVELLQQLHDIDYRG